MFRASILPLRGARRACLSSPRAREDNTDAVCVVPIRIGQKNSLERAATRGHHCDEASRQAKLVAISLKKNSTLFLFSFKTLQAAPNNNLAHRAQGSAAASSDPEAAPYGLDESKGKLHHSHHSAFGVLPPALDAHSLDKLKTQALAKARAMQSSLIAAVKSGGSGGRATSASGASSVPAGSSSSHGGFGVVVPPQAGAAGAPAAQATALSAFTGKLGRLCDKVESSRATAVACR